MTLLLLYAENPNTWAKRAWPLWQGVFFPQLSSAAPSVIPDDYTEMVCLG